MTRADIVAFVRNHPLAVQSTIATNGAPQAAVVGVVVNDDLELLFDTLGTSRKAANLRRDPRIALVVGWDLDEACTVQLEGIADEPTGDELERLVSIYLARFPDGLERRTWPDITYFRVRPRWVRFSDFRTNPPTIVELDEAALGNAPQ